MFTGNASLWKCLPVEYPGTRWTYQKIVVNGGASHIGGVTGKSAVSRIMHKPYSSWTEVAKYKASADRILSGKTLIYGPGHSPRRLDLEYFYSGTGKLERIVLVQEDGSKHTSFSARSS